MIEGIRKGRDRLLINDMAPVQVFDIRFAGKKAGSEMAQLFWFNISELFGGETPLLDVHFS